MSLPRALDEREPMGIWLRKAAPDLAGVFWVLGATALTLLPALRHGGTFAPFSLMARAGLTLHQTPRFSNLPTTDQINVMLPWTDLAWTQVHHGQLPLWNPYEALGMPLAFNWQSAAFSFQAAIGYLVPLRFAYAAQILTNFVVGGTGAYLFGRVIRLRPPSFGVRGYDVRAERSLCELDRAATRSSAFMDRVDLCRNTPSCTG